MKCRRCPTELVKDEKAILIVSNPIHRNDIVRLGISSDRIFTFYEVMKNKVLVDRKYSVAYIDEIGLCLNSLLPRIKYGTHTNEVK